MLSLLGKSRFVSNNQECDNWSVDHPLTDWVNIGFTYRHTPLSVKSLLEEEQ